METHILFSLHILHLLLVGANQLYVGCCYTTIPTTTTTVQAPYVQSLSHSVGLLASYLCRIVAAYAATAEKSALSSSSQQLKNRFLEASSLLLFRAYCYTFSQCIWQQLGSSRFCCCLLYVRTYVRMYKLTQLTDFYATVFGSSYETYNWKIYTSTSTTLLLLLGWLVGWLVGWPEKLQTDARTLCYEERASYSGRFGFSPGRPLK